MLSIGIIWNSAQICKEKIIDDLKEQVKVLNYFDIDFQDNFALYVNSLYQSENMEKWKIEKKLSYMLLNEDTNITIVLFEFDEKNVVFHEFKKKNVYKQLEDTKKYIREKYKNYVEKYTFDIVFHATDNLDELINCYNVLLNFIEKCCKDKDEEKKILKLTINNTLDYGGNNNGND